MATTAATLIQRCRRFIGDWNESDALTASVASNGTTLTVTDGTIYGGGWLVQIDSEMLYVTTKGSGTSVTVRRGMRGTTAASHASTSTVMIRPAWGDLEYLDALNSGIGASFPMLYKPYVDTSTTTTTSTYEYTIPNWDGANPIPYLSRIDFLENSDLAYRTIRDWDVLRGSSPKIKFRRALPPGTLRIYGFGPLPKMTAVTDSLDALFPSNAEDALTLYASSYLLASGEARRVRQDTGAQDARENANQTGSSMSASNSILQRFQLRLQQSAMPPMPRNVKAAL